MASLGEAHAAAVARADAADAALAEARADVDRQADVIAHLMTRSEEFRDAAQLAEVLAAEAAPLRAAMAAQVATLARLAALNEELSDLVNAHAAEREAAALARAAAPAEAAVATDEDGAAKEEGAPPPRRGWLSRAWGAAAYVAGRGRGGPSDDADAAADAV